MEEDLWKRIEEAAAALARRGATSVFAFGSATTGELREDSDIDLAVTGLPPQVFFRAMAEASAILGRPVDLVSLDKDDAVSRSLRSSGGLRRVA